MKHGNSFAAKRIPAALLSIVICIIGIWFSSRLGYARLLAKYASLTGNQAVAAKAVSLTPLDAQAHSSRAAAFYNADSPTEAATELEEAISLRPHDDYLWLRLGILRDELHHPQALNAFDEAVRTAPYYGTPKWQRGNYLLRSGRYDEAFADMRFAATSNLALIPSLIDLAWGVSRQNAELTKQWAGIDDDRKRIAFARFLASHGHGPEALKQFRASRVVSQQARRELIADLLSANAFREAFEIWRGMERDDDRLTAIHDGDFESGPRFDNTGFGWRFSAASQGVRLSLNDAQPQSGKQSLLVAFLGYSEANTTLLSQIVLVEPLKHYRLKFNARAEKLITGGLPIVTVNEAAGKKNLLGQSSPIGFESSAWQELSFDFQTGSAIEAVELRLQRKPCKEGPCPIFGSLWLDSFAIEEVK
jgi:tetratricopeptide (TPR) repeat protein